MVCVGGLVEMRATRAYLPFLDFEAQALDLLLQFAFPLLRGLDVLFELCFKFLAAGLELVQLDLQLFVLDFVVGQFFLDRLAMAKRG